MNWMILLPEWIALGVLLFLVIGEIIKGPKPAAGSFNFVFSSCATLIIFFSLFYWHGPQTAFGGTYLVDNFSTFFKAFFVLAAFVIISMSRSYFGSNVIRGSEFLLILWSCLMGMFFLVSANDFLVMFVALEIVTLSFYIMAAYLKRELISIEAGLKYLILGSLASAFMIYGISLIYNACGSTSFDTVHHFFLVDGKNKLMLLGILLVFSGLGFKVASVPFQLWVPDVYQGAPTPVTAFLAVGSKAAGFAVFLRLVFMVFYGFEPHRSVLFSTLAVMTLLYGNLGALLQTNIKRLFGYSSIGHAGYLLIGIASGGLLGTSSLLFYLIAYAFANLAAFYVITIVGQNLKSDELNAYRGLAKRSPFLASTLFVALLSLAGVPPLAGFFGKFLVLLSAVNSGLWIVALIGSLAVAVSLYYYLSIVRLMFIEESSFEGKIEITGSLKLLFSLLIAGTLIAGLWQAPFFGWAQSAASSLFS